MVGKVRVEVQEGGWREFMNTLSLFLAWAGDRDTQLGWVVKHLKWFTLLVS